MTDRPRFTIAVVDDDQGILDSLESLLESADFSVRLFSSATALLENGCLAEIDGLISDIGMPMMDGHDLVRVVQAARPGLPIFLVTGHPEMLDRTPPLEARFRLFEKPFNGQDLLAALEDALRRPRLH